jgi:hypothetical protein
VVAGNRTPAATPVEVVAGNRTPAATPVEVVVAAVVRPKREATQAAEVAEAENLPGAVAPAPRSRRSSGVDLAHSGTLPCLRRGSSSRLVANIRSPATSFWRVSAGSITSSM